MMQSMSVCSATILILFLAACSTPDKRQLSEKAEKGLSNRGRIANLEKAKMYDLISVEIGTPKTSMLVAEQHLHGKFFKDRAEFYVIEEPELFISGSKVNELTLYFIDGVLCKKKYELSSDISSELIRSYGGFKFIPHSHRTRDLAKSEPILRKTKKGNFLNEKLDRYEMKWDTDEIMIRYRLDRDSLSSEIYLMEELSAYKFLLIEAENEVI